jgi:hypothetical protein
LGFRAIELGFRICSGENWPSAQRAASASKGEQHGILSFITPRRDTSPLRDFGETSKCLDTSSAPPGVIARRRRTEGSSTRSLCSRVSPSQPDSLDSSLRDHMR